VATAMATASGAAASATVAPPVAPPAIPSVAAPATAPSGSAAAAGGRAELRPMDRDILARVDEPLATPQVKDAFVGRPYRVELHQDTGHGRPNRVKIDLNRDGKWDEKWNVDADADAGGGKPRRVKREVSPADDETYTQEWRLEGDSWRLKSH
jgi:hypothetical protein